MFNMKNACVGTVKPGTMLRSSKNLEMGNAVSGVSSIHRKTTIQTGARIMAPSFALEELLRMPLFVRTYAKKVYAEIDDIPVIIEDGKQNWEKKPSSEFLFLLADCIWQYEFGKNAEYRKTFKQAADEITTGNISAETTALFSDSYYFGCIQHPVYEIDCSVVTESVKQLYRKGRLKEPTIPIQMVQESESKVLKDEVVEEKPDQEDIYSIDLKKFMDDVRAGKYQISYGWGDEAKKRIRPMSYLDSYVPSEEFYWLAKKIKSRADRILKRMESLDMETAAGRIAAIGNDAINIILTGDPGTGKTALVYALSAACNFPVYLTTGTRTMEEDAFCGGPRIVDGKPENVATDGLLAALNGGFHVYEEGNVPSPDTNIGGLGQFLEYPYIIKEYGYINRTRHPLCICIFTMNVGTNGTKPMAEMISNRLKTSVNLKPQEKDVFIQILRNKTGAEIADCKWVYNIYQIVLSALDENSAVADTDMVKRMLSLRSCIGALENMLDGQPGKLAVKNSIIGKVAEASYELADICEKTLDALPDR